MDFKQIDKDTFELSFKVGDKIKCRMGELEIMAYVDGFVMYRINQKFPEVLVFEEFKDLIMELDCRF